MKTVFYWQCLDVSLEVFIGKVASPQEMGSPRDGLPAPFS